VSAVIGIPISRMGSSRYSAARGEAGPQQSASPGPASCTGGQGTEPYEQKTQQSPAFGRSTTPQAEHQWKKRQASVGIPRSSS
jgi:hypothetical protein